jgi:hypothetical protein
MPRESEAGFGCEDAAGSPPVTAKAQIAPVSFMKSLRLRFMAVSPSDA